MRKLLLLTAVTMLLAPSASAQVVEPHNPHGVQCQNSGYGPGHARTVCAVVNTQAPLQVLAEGLIDFDAAPYDTENIRIQVVYIRLWRCDNQFGDPCLKVEDTGALGWHNDEEGSLSTDWYNVCQTGNPGKWYHTDIRYRLRWLEVAGDPFGPYTNDNSLSSHECVN